jgi:hypothetical protein
MVIKSLYQTIREQSSNESKWSDVVNGKYIKKLPMKKIYMMSHKNAEDCKFLVCKSLDNEEMGKHQHNIIQKEETQDYNHCSHGRFCVSKVKYGFDNSFEVEGINDY